MTHIRQGEDNGPLTQGIHTVSAYYQSLQLLQAEEIQIQIKCGGIQDATGCRRNVIF